jgi:hypothetical protein
MAGAALRGMGRGNICRMAGFISWIIDGMVFRDMDSGVWYGSMVVSKYGIDVRIEHQIVSLCA